MLNLNKLKTNNAKKCKITITSQLVDAGSAMASLPNAANIKKASIAFTTTIWPETFKNIVKYKFLLDQFLTTFEEKKLSGYNIFTVRARLESRLDSDRI